MVISGRYRKTVDQVVADLELDYPGADILGMACDITDFNQVKSLWDKTLDHFGRVDIWINNAGLAQAQSDFWDLTS